MVSELLDTAAPEAAVTADPPTEAPPSADAPEQAAETPETASVESPETGLPETPETEATKSPLDDLDEDSLLEHPKVKDILARREESARRRAEHEASTRKAADDMAWAQKQEFVNDFADILRNSITEGEDGRTVMRLDPKGIGSVTDRLWQTNVRGSIGATANIVSERLGKDFNISTADAERLRDTHAAFQSDPAGAAADYLDVLLDLTGKAAVEAEAPKLRKEIEKELRKEFETAAEASSRQKAEESARKGGAPTNVNGSAPGNYDLNTISGLSRAHADGQLTQDEYARRLMAL